MVLEYPTIRLTRRRLSSIFYTIETRVCITVTDESYRERLTNNFETDRFTTKRHSMQGDQAYFCTSEVRKYQEVHRSTKKYQEVQRSTQKYQEVPRSTKKYREVPRSTEKYRSTLYPLAKYASKPTES